MSVFHPFSEQKSEVQMTIMEGFILFTESMSRLILLDCLF